MRTATLIRALSIAAFTVVASIGARAQETIKIGWLSSLTGPLSSAAIAENQGVQFAVEEINNGGGILGRKIVSARLHGIDNFRGRERLVRTDTQTPGFMLAPFEHAAAFAFESAIDELAYALEQDPVALRLANDTTTIPSQSGRSPRATSPSVCSAGRSALVGGGAPRRRAR